MRSDSEPAPPAGGFGQTPHSASFGPQIGPQPKRGAVVTIVAVGVLVVCGFGALAGWGLWKRDKNVQTAEARVKVGYIAALAMKTYDANGDLCPTTAPVPAHIDMVRGMRYQSIDRDWKDDPGWSCLGFELDQPQRYQYRFERTADGFVVTAEGDLDGDDVDSQFRATGHFRKGDPPSRRGLWMDPAIAETNPGE